MDYLWGIVLLLWTLGAPERGADAQRSKNDVPRLKLSYKGQSPPDSAADGDSGKGRKSEND